MMKTTMKFWAAVVAAILFVGCGGGDDNDGGGSKAPKPDGWELMTWDGSDALQSKVFLALNDDLSFALYQCIATPDFKKFTGTYSIDEQSGVLTGTYADGTAFEDSYRIVEMTETALKMQSVKGGIESVYRRVVIPDYAKVPGPSVSAYASVEEIPFL